MFSIPSGTWPKKVHLQSCKYHTVNNTLLARSDSSMFYTWLTPSVLHGLFSIPYLFSCTKWWPPTLLSFNQTISLPLSPPPQPISLYPAPPPLCFTSWPVPYRKWLPRRYTPDGADPTLVISGFFDFSSPENLNLLLPLLDDCRSTWNLIIEPFSSKP